MSLISPAYAATHAADSVAALSVYGSIAGWFPPLFSALGAVLAVIWYSVEIYESEICQKWRKRRAEKQQQKKIEKARQFLLEVEQKNGEGHE